MSEKIYSKLSREPRCIRLLELSSARDYSSDIQCTLREVQLGWQRSYKALSYAWKDDDEPFQPVAEVSLVRHQSNSESNKYYEEKINIPKNLSLALRRLRLPDRSLTLWVDSLCINQVDNDERTHQVGMMSEIYWQASEVIIWLGERETEDELGEWLQGIFQRMAMQCTWYDDQRSQYMVEAYLRGFTELKSRTGAIRPNRDVHGAFCLIWLLSQGKRSTEIEFYHAALSTPFRTEWGAQVIQGLRAIMARNWWRRSWVVQETVLARKATIHYSTISAPWTMFAKAAINYNKERSIEDLDRLDIYRGGLNVYGAPITYDALTEFSNAVLAIETTRSEWTSKQPITLFPLLRRFRSRKSSDDRDKVFALLGLVNKWVSQPVLVNYNASIAQVYLETTVQNIRSTKLLSGLAGTLYKSTGVSSAPSMPSWVTNWSVPAQVHEMERLGRLDLYSASGGKSSHVCLHGSSVLEVKGYLVGVIVHISPTAPESGIQRLRRTISEWEDSWRKSDRWDNSQCQYEHLNRRSAFWRTICADALYVTRISKESGLREGFYQRADDRGQAAFEAWKSDGMVARNRYTSIYGDSIINSYVEPEKVSESKNSIHYAVQSASGSRSLFSFKQISGLHPSCACHIGVGPHDMQLGDYVCVVLGSNVPFILRYQNPHKCNYAPKKDLISAEDASNASFETCTEIHINCFTVVGDAYVHGMMNSEAIRSGSEQLSIFLV